MSSRPLPALPLTGCRSVYFCGEECSTRAWKEMGHKAECKAAAAAATGGSKGGASDKKKEEQEKKNKQV